MTNKVNNMEVLTVLNTHYVTSTNTPNHFLDLLDDIEEQYNLDDLDACLSTRVLILNEPSVTLVDYNSTTQKYQVAEEELNKYLEAEGLNPNEYDLEEVYDIDDVIYNRL